MVGDGQIETRWSSGADDSALARLHGDAWRFAYAGVIPGLTLERMIAGRGAGWWARMHRSGARVLVIELGGEVRGYAMLGRCRTARFSRAGEIYELYLEPACHGAGLGRALFEAARARLSERPFRGLIVWSLAVNEIGCRFYQALGGRAKARGRVRLGGVTLERIAYAWG